MADLYALLFHLKRCPGDFLQPPSTIHTAALIKDVYRLVYGDMTVPDSKLPVLAGLERFGENEAISMHIACWFFIHENFSSRPDSIPGIHSFIFQHLPEVCRHVTCRLWVEDEDRAEEFVRLALRCCGWVPSGETPQEAADRFDALSTLKRLQVLQETNESLQRIKDIRQKMADSKAREAANVYGRE